MRRTFSIMESLTYLRRSPILAALRSASLVAFDSPSPRCSWQRRTSFQRKAQFLTDFVEAENSMGFHAPQEAARLLGHAIDYARQGQVILRR